MLNPGPKCATVQSRRKVLMADNEGKSIFDNPPDEAEEARLDAAAEAEIEAGQFVTHDKVVEWLKSWGTPDELPCPKPEPR